MKCTSEERLYQALLELCQGRCEGITAMELAEGLELSRNVVSHYLNRLLEKGLAVKLGTKPAYWRPCVTAAVTQEAEEATRPAVQGDAFSTFIGWDGSCREAVERCRAAVHYPSDGLPILLCGPSGVGKSALAALIHRYAVESGAVEPNAPFITFNCADYANNPQLLSATLFGYRKGAFTGADADREGMLQAAGNGFLFLDEVHRLSAENQEKLFVLLDQGCFRPLGENKDWSYVKVRLICATTEDVDQVLLKTFRRRIPVRADIPPYAARPLNERLRLVYHICRKEAVRLGRDVALESAVLDYLLDFSQEGNIGALINLIKLTCAGSFHRQEGGGPLRLEAWNLPVDDLRLPTGNGQARPRREPLTVWRDERAAEAGIAHDPAWKQSGLNTFWNSVTEDRGWELEEVRGAFRETDSYFAQANLYAREFTGMGRAFIQLFERACATVCDRYGISDKELLPKLDCWYLKSRARELSKVPSASAFVAYLHRKCPRTAYVMDRMLEALDRELPGDCLRRDLFSAALYFLLSPHVDESCPFHALIVAHGDSTATSVASVTNRMCRSFVFEGIDMPMDTSVDTVIERVNEYIDKCDTRQGMILLVDMGSLSRMYGSIKNRLKGDLLIVNNMTTAIALDIGIKIVGHSPFKKIAEYAKTGYVVQSQYYEGLALDKNVVISCISGLGIAEKLREIVREYVNTDILEIVTMDYRALKRNVDKGDHSQFKNTQVILTTSELAGGTGLPILYLPDLWTPEGEQKLWRALSAGVDQAGFEKLKEELFKFFSIEGVSSRLSFLNPSVIIGEVDGILRAYEQHYSLKLESFRRLNLFLHISVMIERLLVGDKLYTESAQSGDSTAGELEAFYEVSRGIFGGIIAKYHIELAQGELALLYELLMK